MVIVHGFNSHSGYYQWVAEQLAAKNFETYAVDLDGRGFIASLCVYLLPALASDEAFFSFAILIGSPNKKNILRLRLLADFTSFHMSMYS